MKPLNLSIAMPRLSQWTDPNKHSIKNPLPKSSQGKQAEESFHKIFKRVVLAQISTKLGLFKNVVFSSDLKIFELNKACKTARFSFQKWTFHRRFAEARKLWNYYNKNYSLNNFATLLIFKQFL